MCLGCREISIQTGGVLLKIFDPFIR